MKNYNIQNKILKALIGDTEVVNGKIIKGFTNGKSFGTTALTFLVKKAFNIHRLPMWEDRHFTEKFNMDKDTTTLSDIIDSNEFKNNINDMIFEIKEIYNFTQNYLNIQYPNQDTIPLIRNLNGDYAIILLQMKKNAEKNGKDYIEIGTDILNSFTDNFGAYHMMAEIKMDISKKNILYCYNILDNIMEPHEFIVINKRIDGLLKIPISCISETFLSSKEYNISKKEYGTKYNFINFASNNSLYFLNENNSQIQYNLIQKFLLKLINFLYNLIYRIGSPR